MMLRKIDVLENSARRYNYRKDENELLSSSFGGTPTASCFEKDVITEAVYLEFLEDCDARRKRIPP